MPVRHTHVNVVRGILILLACVFGWLVAATIRTMHPGIQVGSIGAEVAFACVPAVTLGLLSVIGLRWRTKLLVVGLVIGVSVLSAELWAATEEFVFVRKHLEHSGGT